MCAWSELGIRHPPGLLSSPSELACWTDSLKDSFTSVYSSAAHFPQALGDEAGMLLEQRQGRAEGIPVPPPLVCSSRFGAVSLCAGCCMSGAGPALGDDLHAVILGIIMF